MLQGHTTKAMLSYLTFLAISPDNNSILIFLDNLAGEAVRKEGSIQPYFEKDEFNDNVGGMMKGMSLGKKNYDRKVFNDLTGTFSFGPKNRLYIGAFRRFIRFDSSDGPKTKR